jgi:hypothetical protein
MANGKERFTTWKIIEKILMACLAVIMVMWWGALGTVCSEPAEQNVATRHVISFNCHGTVVFITPLRSALLTWLMPMFLVVGLAWRAAQKRATRTKRVP